MTILLLLALLTPYCACFPQNGKIMLAGKDKVDLEEDFWNGLQVFMPKGDTVPVKNVKKIEKNLYVSENGWYRTEAIQNTAFFQKSLFLWQPVCESVRPAESVMTLLTGHVGNKKYTVHLFQHRYKFGSAETDIPLSILLEYCMTMGCTPYVGIESAETDTIIATLFMVNLEGGYCHSFKFSIDKALLDFDEGTLLAEAYTFTPINNLKQ